MSVFPCIGISARAFALCALALPATAQIGVNSYATTSAVKVATTTALSVSPSPVDEGASAQISVTVAEVGASGVPTGRAALLANGATFATVNLAKGKATLRASSAGLAAGTYTVTAKYLGDAGNAASTSSPESVNVLGTTSTRVAFGEPGYSVGKVATVHATVAAPSGGAPGGTVKFSVGTIAIGSAPLVSGVATLQASTAGLAPGTYPVTATYLGNSQFLRSSGTASVALVPPYAVTPAYVSLIPSGTTQFALSPAASGAVTWSVNGIPGGDSYLGTIDANGNYTAPASTHYASTATITAAVAGDSVAIPAAYAVVSVAGVVANTPNNQVASYAINVPEGASVVVNFGTTTAYGLNTWSVPAPAGGGTVDMLVAGMLRDTTYHMQAVVSLPGGLTFTDADHTFATNGSTGETVKIVTNADYTPQPGVEMLDLFYLGAYVYDLSGNELWTYPVAGGTGSSAVQPFKQLADGNFLIGVTPESAYPVDGTNIQPNTPIEIREVTLGNQVVRDLDLATLQTSLNNFGYVNALGDAIALQDMHHEVTVNPTNGHWLIVSNTTQVFDNLAGQTGPVTALGDVILDVDPNNNFAVDWVWNEFDHLDINRQPMGFPDWTHTNAITYSADDGNILVSMRHQSWIVKVNYQNGAGDGSILWRFGYQGDFTLVGGTDPIDWQYAQHEPSFTTSNTTGVFGLTMMDNGDSRVLGSSPCPVGGSPCNYSRAPIFTVDENAMTATLSNGAAGPSYSGWGGNSNLLANGDVEVDYCAAAGGSIIQELTVGSSPQLVWQATTTGSQNYRAHRVGSFYPGVTWSTDALKFQADHAVRVK